MEDQSKEMDRQLTLIAETSYGSENEAIVDKLETFNKQAEDLEKNINFFETVTSKMIVVPGRKYVFEVTKAITNSSFHKFWKYFRIKGLGRRFRYITIEIGGQKMDQIYDFCYDVLEKYYKIPEKYKDYVVFPFGLIPVPIPVWHNTKFTFETNGNFTEEIEIEIMYDVYLYNMVTDPMGIVECQEYKQKTIPDGPFDKETFEKTGCGADDCYPDGCTCYNRTYQYSSVGAYDRYVNSFREVKKSKELWNETFFENNKIRSINLGQVVYQHQYTGDETITIGERMKTRINFMRPINCIALNVPEGVDVAFAFYGNAIDMTPEYRVGEFAVYTFPYINFSRVDKCQLIIEDTSGYPVHDESDGTKYGKLQIFAFNIQLLRTAGGMCGLAFSK